MSSPLDNLYLVWLYSHVGDVDVKVHRRTYWKLLRKLYSTEFIWIVPNDDARVEDGRDLRYEFFEDAEIPYNDETDEWLHLGCSFFEMLIGLSRRLGYLTESSVKDSFWHILRNIGLHEYNDAYSSDFSPAVEEVTNRIIWRTYGGDGHGGLFPLRRAEKDQTKIEIWYQLNTYVLEKEHLGG